MINGRKIVVCLPAFNAAKTLQQTYNDIPFGVVDDIVLVDDASKDNTISIATQLGIKNIFQHNQNKGYGGNQKTCYRMALQLGADVIVMLHPDYQYNPKLIPSLAYLVAHDIYPVVLGSRILGKGAVKNGMPVYKYVSNRILTFIQNIVFNRKLSEYHTGYRTFSKEVLQSINFCENSDDFVFDNQFLAQVVYKGYAIGELSCPAKYFPEASSISFTRSVVYGFGVLITCFQYMLAKLEFMNVRLFQNPD